jgi:hypothetical protein
MKPIIVLLAILILFLSACSPAAATPVVSVTPENTSTPTVTSTPRPTNTPQPTPTPVDTSTPTPMPEDVIASIQHNYAAFILAQTEAVLLNETADRVNTGKLTGFDSLGAVIAAGMLSKVVDESLPQVVQLDALKDNWAEIMSNHAKTRALLTKWLNKEIDSGAVVQGMTPILAAIDATMKNAEEVLSRQYGISRDALAKIREDAKKSLADAFSTKTPTAKP